MTAPALEIRQLDKRFGGHQALAGVDLTVRHGEVHALLGENGAGKSTLIKILAGAVQRDAGDILVGGRNLSRQHSPAEAARSGLAFVHQDLGLVDDLTVAENLALELGFSKRRGLIAFGATERRVAKLLSDLSVDVSPRAMVGSLAQDEKVMVAVTRAVSKGAAAVVLDEVSSSLPAPEMKRLATALRGAQRSGIAYVYVTHRLEEVFDLADRVTVLRDGRRVTTADVVTTTHEQLVSWILGATVEQPAPFKRREPEGDRAGRLRVRGLTSAGLAEALSFEVAAGEVLGVCGLIGSGSRQVARLLGGAATPTGGTATLDQSPLRLGDPGGLARAGCAYVPGNRVAEGAVPEMSVRENLFMVRQHTVGDSMLIRPRHERAQSAALAERYDVRPTEAGEKALSSLSGGNQQKVIFARALRGRPSLLVLDDPTAGVDVGSRVQLHGFLREAARDGAAVLLASTDFEEIAGEADRVLVMRHGRVAAEFSGEEATPDRLARASYGTTSADGRSEVQS